MSHAQCGRALAVLSPAKINLALTVSHRRDDGFHEIDSVVAGTSLHDELLVGPCNDESITLSTDAADLDVGGDNLIVRAAAALRRHTGCDLGARITLHKRIPIAAGLAGGSSNAAAALTALNRLWALDLSDDELRRVGATLGSDVPLFFELPAARITGRGEIVRPFSLRWSGWAVLAFTAGHVRTDHVYAAWSPDDRCGDVRDRAERIAEAATADELAPLCVNELEQAVYRTADPMRAFHDSVRRAGAPHARISGAGRTVYALFDQREDAELLRERMLTTELCTGAVVAAVPTLPQPKT